ncbi:uncharacterized protein LOC132258945 [Phlebotomus argentipes]|uniref:uncharacterized protein LOC132258945 n=1 Tax=Phlebotomus argentipes TaxID=94469 RepID=UPI0028937D51|nr:uncharacterized protein LOC132258945 [Phlebotomus argentipes]XP_059612491.1 uncharacterized protein LOC132258945 [Phlebotomus argentipes]
MAPTISVSNERKPKCRRSQRRNQQPSSSSVSVISYGRTVSRRSCWYQRPSRLPAMGKACDRDNRRESVDGEASDGSLKIAVEPHRRHSTTSMSDSDSSSGCSSACYSTDVSNSQFCRCDSLNMSDFDDDGFKEDKSELGYPTRVILPAANKDWHGTGSNTKGLLDIAIKTIKLIQRNQLLQMKLAQLQAETHAFITSVMANPENREADLSHSDRESSMSSPGMDET